MPSSHLILCHPLLFLPSTPLSIRVFSNESTPRMRWPKYWSFSFSIIPSKEIPGLISFRTDLLDTCMYIYVYRYISLYIFDIAFTTFYGMIQHAIHILKSYTFHYLNVQVWLYQKRKWRSQMFALTSVNKLVFKKRQYSIEYCQPFFSVFVILK